METDIAKLDIQTCRERGYISLRALNVCLRCNISTIGDLSSYAKRSDLSTLPGAGQRTVGELKELLQHVHTASPETFFGPTPSTTPTRPEYLDVLSLLSNHATIVARKILDNIIASLPRRAQRMAMAPEFDLAAALAVAHGSVPPTLIKSHVGHTTIATLQAALAGFSATVIELATASEAELFKRELSLDYDFISDTALQQAEEFHAIYGTTPMLSILLGAVQAATSHATRIWAMHMGIIGEPHQLYDIARLATEWGLTRERVRQIISTTPVDDTIARILTSPLWDTAYPWLKADVVIPSEVFNAMPPEPGVDTPRILAGLIMLLGHHTRVNVRTRAYPVHPQLAAALNFRRTLTAIETLVQQRCSEPRRVDISYILNANLNNQPNGEDIKPRLTAALSHILLDACNLRLDPDATLHVPQNHVNVAPEVANILAAKGQPMTLIELFNAFKDKFPEHRYTTPAQLRPYLTGNPGVVPIGKESTYAPPSWKGNVMSIRQLIRQYLTESPVPLSVTQIVERLHADGRNTTANSVNTSIWTSRTDRFVKYAPNRFGLEGKDYGPEFVPVNRKATRHRTFDERLDMFEAFLDTHGYLPSSSAVDPEEATLYRWYYNTTTGRLDITDEQRHTFEQMLERHRDHLISYPRHQCIQNCRRVHEFIDNHGHLPTRQDGVQLYTWLHNHLTHTQTHPDRAHPELRDLIDTLQSRALI